MTEINLLWTGGWDSTFRLLDLVLIQNMPVRPFYVIDTGRPSTLNELKAMYLIREEIAKRNPQLAYLIKPTIIVSIHDIKPDPDISNEYNRLKESSHIGTQYDWLARFAKQWNISSLELCIGKGDHVYELVSEYLKNRSKINDEITSIFSFFNFPLLNLSKLDMKK